MDVIYPRCCGLDVHKKTVVACCLLSTEGRKPVKETRTFRTMTTDLLAVTDCNRNEPGLQSARFPDHIICIYHPGQDRIICH
jgi:hypothetical protein